MSNNTASEPGDGGTEQETPVGHDQYSVVDVAHENAFHFDTEEAAKAKLEKAKHAPDVEPEIYPPGQSPAYLRKNTSPDP